MDERGKERNGEEITVSWNIESVNEFGELSTEACGLQKAIVTHSY